MVRHPSKISACKSKKKIKNNNNNNDNDNNILPTRVSQVSGTDHDSLLDSCTTNK